MKGRWPIAALIVGSILIAGYFLAAILRDAR